MALLRTCVDDFSTTSDSQSCRTSGRIAIRSSTSSWLPKAWSDRFPSMRWFKLSWLIESMIFFPFTIKT